MDNEHREEYSQAAVVMVSIVVVLGILLAPAGLLTLGHFAVTGAFIGWEILLRVVAGWAVVVFVIFLGMFSSI